AWSRLIRCCSATEGQPLGLGPIRAQSNEPGPVGNLPAVKQWRAGLISFDSMLPAGRGPRLIRCCPATGLTGVGRYRSRAQSSVQALDHLINPFIFPTASQHNLTKP